MPKREGWWIKNSNKNTNVCDKINKKISQRRCFFEQKRNFNYRENKTNIIKYKDDENGTKFVYMTDLSITNKNIEETIYLGRKRWKIENEGFNIQKNRTFDIGHLYSKNSIVIKVHYLMIRYHV